MALSNEEIAILTAFLNAHGIVEYVYPVGDTDRITNLIQWLEAVPNATDYNDENPLTGIKQILYGLSFTEKVAIFGYDSATHWYRQILLDIKEGTITDNLVKKYIDLFSQKVSNMNALTLAFNQFLSRVVQAKDIEFLNQIFYIMLKQDLISQSSLDKILIEFSTLPRFTTIGLSALPTSNELETILAT